LRYKDILNEQTIALDNFRVESVCSLADIKLPEVVTLNNLFEVEFTIKNMSGKSLDLVVTILHADNFFVNGAAESRIKLDPATTFPLKIKIIPLKVGYYMLQKIRITDFKTKEEYLISEHQAFVRVLPPRSVPTISANQESLI
jgi:hypothetical protein